MPLDGRIIRLEELEGVLCRLSRSGTYYEFGKRRFVGFETDKKHLAGEGRAQERKEFPIAVASVDVCQDSELCQSVFNRDEHNPQE